MKSLVIFLCLFLGYHEAEADKTIMLFPKQTSTDFVTLKTPNKVLKQLTVCLRSYSELTREHALFSLATPGSGRDNAVLIYPMPPNNISISINNEDIYFRVDPEVLDWKHTCVAWDSVTGLLQLWVNGKRYPRKITRSTTPIGPQMSVMIGQDQDDYGGALDINQSFIGELCDVNMWDYVLPPEVIKGYFDDYYTISGNVYSWVKGTYTIQGQIVSLTNQFYHTVNRRQCKPT